MYVLFLTRKWPHATGGMETYSQELCRELQDIPSVRLDILALPGRHNGLPPSGLTLGWFLLRTSVYLLRTRQRWDLVHFGDFVLFPLAWWHACIAPQRCRVITVHGLDLIFGNRRGWKAALYRRFMAWAKRRRGCLDGIIANSRNTAKLANQAGLGMSHVVPLGVRLTECSPAGDNDKTPYILFVGRLVPRKGAAWFAQAVLPHCPGLCLRVVGKTWDLHEEKALRLAPRTQLLGRVSDTELARLRAGAVAVVMPNIPSTGTTDVEGFGLTALEAAACAPLLAANIEGLSDAVVDGISGFLLPSQQAAPWVSKLQEITQWSAAERQNFLQGARQRLAQDYTWQQVAQSTVAIYREIYTAKKTLPGTTH